MMRMTPAVQAHWLQYQGLTLAAECILYRVENAAWKTVPQSPADEPEITGLMVAT